MRRNLLAVCAASALAIAVPVLFACEPKATPASDSAALAGTTLVSTTGGDSCCSSGDKASKVSTGGSCSSGDKASAKETTLVSTEAKAAGEINVQEHMKMLKTLAGKWEATEPGPDGNKGQIEFKTTANGSVIVETMFPGKEYEMINTYVADGERVLVTHYCASGNQPRMQLVHSDGKTMRFEFVDATNLESRNADHMGTLELTLDGADKIKESWTSFKGGKAEGENMTFELVRVK